MSGQEPIPLCGKCGGLTTNDGPLNGQCKCDPAPQEQAQETPPDACPTFSAADIVHHAPSGEDWVLAVDEENGRIQPCGWPPTMADAKDCTLTTPATAEHRIAMLQEWAAEGKGIRT